MRSTQQADRPHVVETLYRGQIHRYFVASLRGAVIRAACLDPFSNRPEALVALRPATAAEVRRHGRETARA
jgi:hypothetical protein